MEQGACSTINVPIPPGADTTKMLVPQAPQYQIYPYFYPGFRNGVATLYLDVNLK